MRSRSLLPLFILLAHRLIPVARARTIPRHAIFVHTDITHADPSTPIVHNINARRSWDIVLSGLPQPWKGIFRSLNTIQPPLPAQSFAHFFLAVAQTARGDRVWARPFQRFTYGALILEFAASDDGSKLVTKEFVEATATWLLNQVREGWTGFFEALLIDQAQGEKVYVHLSNTWDAWMKLPAYDDLLDNLPDLNSL